MVHVVIFRLYTPQEAIALADEPDLLMKRIRNDRRRSPMAVLQSDTAAGAAEVVETLSRAFGVCIMDIHHHAEPLPTGHYLLDQGEAMLKDAEQITQK